MKQLLQRVTKPNEKEFSNAQEPYNKDKNRYPDRLPCESVVWHYLCTYINSPGENPVIKHHLPVYLYP